MNERTFSERALALAPKWHRLCYAILHNEADCEDAVQEALLRAWSGIKGLREDAYFETWFTRILINESRQILRKRARNRAEALPETIPTPQPDDALRFALGRLELKLRLPILLYHMEGYKIAEIAVMLALPVTTVKWRLCKGRNELRRLIKEANA